MNNNIISRAIALLLLFGAISCSQPAGYAKPDDGLDAGREYIRAVLDGDYEKAELYIPPVTEERKFFDRYKEYMRQRPMEELQGLKASSIIVNQVEPQGDSVVLIHYANSFTKKPQDVRMVRREGAWWIDFKYTFSSGLPKNEP